MKRNDKKLRLLPLVGFVLLVILALTGCPEEVEEPTVTSLAVTTQPRTTTYWQGEYLDPTGMVVTATWSNGETTLVPWHANSGIDTDPREDEALTESGEQTINVGYEGAVGSFAVEVKPTEVDSLAVKKMPNDMDYMAGDKFVAEGLVVTVSMTDGTTQDILWSSSDENFTLYPANGSFFNDYGNQTVKVQYRNAEVDLPVDVADSSVASISIKKKPEIHYKLAEATLDPSGMILTATMKDGTTKDIPWDVEKDNISLYPFGGTTFTEEGTETIKIRYKGSSVDYDIYIMKPVLTIKSEPSKIHFKLDETFAASGLEAIATWTADDGYVTTEDLFWNNLSLSLANGTKLTSEGKKNVTATYRSASADFSIYAMKPVLDIKSSPSDIYYKLDEKFKASGLKVTVTWTAEDDYETTQDASWSPSSGISLSLANDTKLTTSGRKTVTATYLKASDSFSIYAMTPSLTLKSGPSDTDYDVGEDLDSSGTKVTVKWTATDGHTESEDRTSGLSYSPSSLSSSGRKKIAVSYKGASSSFYVYAYDVYLPGFTDIGGVQTAGYWKNGTFHRLGNGSYTSNAYCLIVDDGDVYAGGYQRSSTGYDRGGYWDSRGSFHSVYSWDNNVDSYDDSYVRSMLFKSGDLLLGGYCKDRGGRAGAHAAIWNATDGDVERILAYGFGIEDMWGPFEEIVCSDICLIGSTVYAAGWADAQGDDGSNNAANFINCAPGSWNTHLHDSTTYSSAANGIVNDNGTPYFVGYDNNGSHSHVAALWSETGSRWWLGDTDSAAYGGVEVDGREYIVGYQNGYGGASTDVAGYWEEDKNNSSNFIFHPVASYGSGWGNSYGRSIYINDDGDVYVGGNQLIGSYKACYWKNGVRHILSSSHSVAYYDIVRDR